MKKRNDYITLEEWHSLANRKRKINRWLSNFGLRRSLDKKRLVIGGIWSLVCVVTLGTNWMLPFSIAYMMGVPINIDPYKEKIKQVRYRLK